MSKRAYAHVEVRDSLASGDGDLSFEYMWRGLLSRDLATPQGVDVADLCVFATYAVQDVAS